MMFYYPKLPSYNWIVTIFNIVLHFIQGGGGGWGKRIE